VPTSQVDPRAGGGFEFQLASVPLHEVRARLGKLLIEAAKLLAQEFDFVATDAAA
jgi:hypothetical protein